MQSQLSLHPHNSLISTLFCTTSLLLLTFCFYMSYTFISSIYNFDSRYLLLAPITECKPHYVMGHISDSFNNNIKWVHGHFNNLIHLLENHNSMAIQLGKCCWHWLLVVFTYSHRSPEPRQEPGQEPYRSCCNPQAYSHHTLCNTLFTCFMVNIWWWQVSKVGDNTRHCYCVACIRFICRSTVHQ